MLFCLLLQHCDDKIKESIEHFSEKGDLAYALAKSKLQREFGRPCIIADICEQRLKEAPQVKSNHPASIKGFSELLEKSLITLQSLKIAGSFN